MRATWYALPLAGIVATGCASMKSSGESGNPTAQQVQTSQQQSTQALNQANEVQKKASDQEHKAAQARADVQQKQQELAQAQQKAKDEQTKAEQLQREANRETRQATQQAQQSQQQAQQALATSNQQVQRGELTTTGVVQQVNQDQLTVQPSSGQPMTFRITDRTQVRIDGQQSSASDIKQGEHAFVAYQVAGMHPNAVSIQVSTGTMNGASQQGTGSGSQGSTGSQGSWNGSSGTGNSSQAPSSSTGR